MTDYRIQTGEVIKQVYEMLPKKTPVVDAGGGGFKHWMEDLLGIKVQTWDAVPGEDVDLAINLTERPWRYKNVAGIIVCTSVLEHVSKPWVVAENLISSLVIGGGILVTAPFVYKPHDSPKDYWRFLPAGLRELFSPLRMVSTGMFSSEDGKGSYYAGVREK